MIIFIHGEDTYRSRAYLHKLKNKYLKEIDNTGSNLSQINGEKTNIAEINNAVSTASLLVKKRMVIIENLFCIKNDKSLDDIYSLFKQDKIQNSDSNILIIWESIGEKERLTKQKKELKKFLISTKYSPKPFNRLTPRELVNWIINYTISKNSTITNEAANLLCSYTQNDLWLISNELDKLIYYKLPNGIDANDVKNMVTALVNDNIFALIDSIGNRNKGAALNLLKNQLEFGANEFQILSLILRQFKILARVKSQSESGLTKTQIANITKIHPFVVKKSLIQAKNYTLKTITTLINKLTEYDFMAKTGKIKASEMLEMFILTF